MYMKIAIVGTRTFNDYISLKEFIFEHIKLEDITYIVSGGAKGADALAEKFAKEYGFWPDSFIEHEADWNYYGLGAGNIRNSLIARDADMLFSFWNGISSGSRDMLKKIKKEGKPYFIYLYEQR